MTYISFGLTMAALRTTDIFHSITTFSYRQRMFLAAFFLPNMKTFVHKMDGS